MALAAERQKSQDQFPFFELSRELRDLIYQHLEKEYDLAGKRLLTNATVVIPLT